LPAGNPIAIRNKIFAIITPLESGKVIAFVDVAELMMVVLERSRRFPGITTLPVPEMVKEMFLFISAIMDVTSGNSCQLARRLSG